MIPNFDDRVFQALSESLEGVFPEILAVFFEETESSLKILKTNIDEKNIDDVHDIAHKIKSSAKTFGANNLVQILEEMERLHTFDDNKISDLKDSFESEYFLVKEHISNKL